MKTDELKSVVNALNELSESYADLMQTMKGTIKEVKATKQLWRDKNKSKLVKLGLALIVFPEPTPISETIGAILVTAGTVQQGIRNRAIYVDDVPKAFKKTLKEIQNLKRDI
ncbi:MAG: hypothetical protein ACPLW8_01765 [Candidatus Bathyarchaeales archaeon]